MTSVDDLTAGAVARPPAPAGESAGPPLTDLVIEVRRALRAELSLLAQARGEAQAREHLGVASGQLDASGNALLKLFEVPAGATGYLMAAALDEPAVATAANPDTNANLWHGIFAGGPAARAPADVIGPGSLLDCRPLAPTPDAQIPFVYTYGSERAAPTLVGPGTFYAVIQAATAGRLIVCRWHVYVAQPEP
jgi:hypothetical protein